ncbi:hypothetical protein ACLOJK_036237 [Asimina triloba]
MEKEGEGLGQDFAESPEKELLKAEVKGGEEFGHLDSGQYDGKMDSFSAGARFGASPDSVEGNSAKENSDGEGHSESKDDDEDMENADVLDNAGNIEEVSVMKEEKENGEDGMDAGHSEQACFVGEPSNQEAAMGEEQAGNLEGTNQSFPSDPQVLEGYDSGTEDEQADFMRELANFFRDRGLEFKPPKFYGEGLNCLKQSLLQPTKEPGCRTLPFADNVCEESYPFEVLDGPKPASILELATLSKPVQHGTESPLLVIGPAPLYLGHFDVSMRRTEIQELFAFTIFALLDYERYKMRGGELHAPAASPTGPIAAENQGGSNQASGSGRARRDAAARAMQGWHSQRLLGNGEVGDPIIKDKNSVSLSKREKQLKNLGVLKRKKPSSLERAMTAVKAARTKGVKPQVDSMVVDVGPPADWVKINVRRTKDCFEIYALVPGLLREEVRVQSDPAGRLVISGNPEQPDNPWGVVSLPSRIDPHQTSAVVTLHGQLFVRAPFEQSDL